MGFRWLVINKMAKKKRNGRPSLLETINPEQIKILASFGLTDEQMAQAYGVSEVTFNAWKKKNEKFLKSLKDGKSIADNNVVKSLYHRAIGYTHPEEEIFCHKGKIIKEPTIKHYAPDVMAAIYWLNNRREDEWKNRSSHQLSGPNGKPIETHSIALDLKDVSVETLLKLAALQNDKC